MMHREIIAKRKVPVIVITLTVLTIFLYISEAIERSNLNRHILGRIFNWTLVVLTLALIFREIRSCRQSYKHAIIADKLIINRITSREEKNLESIKISDILYIGKRVDIPKKYAAIRRCKSYLCNRIGDDVYYCIYNNDNKVKKIKFQPSDLFIKRIIKHGRLACNMNNKIN
ncbi:hypothetical protein JCM1393_13680 [Clostridium carnis]